MTSYVKNKRKNKTIKDLLSNKHHLENGAKYRLNSHYGFLGIDIPELNIFLKSSIRLPTVKELNQLTSEEKKKLIIDYEIQFLDLLRSLGIHVMSEEWVETNKADDLFSSDEEEENNEEEILKKDDSIIKINLQLSNDWQKKGDLCNSFSLFASTDISKLNLFKEKRKGEMSIGIVTLPFLELFSKNFTESLKTKILEQVENLKLSDIEDLGGALDRAIENYNKNKNHKESFLHFHLQSVIKVLLKERLVCDNFEDLKVCVLVEYWQDKDVIVCSLTGGKRDLGETEDESELRENIEELGNTEMKSILKNSKKQIFRKWQNRYVVHLL